MYNLNECQPKPAIVSDVVADLTTKAKTAPTGPAASFYQYRAFEIRRLISIGEYRHAVNVLADSCRSGRYAAACVWSVAEVMMLRDDMTGFYNFKRAIITMLKERRISDRYVVASENAISFMKGETDNPTAAMLATIADVQLRPMIAAYRAACSVTLSADSGTNAERAERVAKLIDKASIFC